jgi:putative transposase
MKLAPQELRTYLLTFVTAQRRRLFQVSETAELFVQTLNDYRAQGRFDVHAYLVMPDHVHVLLTPAADVSLEKAVQFIKGGFSFRLKRTLDVWERGYDSRRVGDEPQFDAFRGYVEANPVRGGLVVTAEEYLYSSCGRGGVVDPKPVWLRGGRARG